MGTRHVIMVVVADQIKVAQYGQWDGYPDGAGVEILYYLKKAALGKLLVGATHCQFITDSEADELDAKFALDKEAAKQWWDGHPQLSRDVSYKILRYVSKQANKRTKLLLQDYSEFANGGVGCEHTYVIDFTTFTLEVYTGHHSYTDAKFPNTRLPKMKLMASYSLKNLPTTKQFLEDCKEEH
jgi:hypothetical protein